MTEITNEAILQWRWHPGEVTDGIFVGGDLPEDADDAADHLERWVDQGITHVLDLREEWSDEELVATLAPDVQYTHLGTHDNGGAQAADWFEAGAKVGRQAALDWNSGLLVHCHMGVNRGPSMAFAILLDRGWVVSAALDAIRAARPIAAVAYAEDAVRWHMADSDPAEMRSMVEEVRSWHERNHIDIGRVIRRIRGQEEQAA